MQKTVCFLKRNYKSFIALCMHHTASEQAKEGERYRFLCALFQQQGAKCTQTKIEMLLNSYKCYL